jgi:hypothetical protein
MLESISESDQACARLREISPPEAGFNATSHELKQDANGGVCVLLLGTVGKKQQHAKRA